MKITRTITEEVEVSTMYVCANVRHWKDVDYETTNPDVNAFPLRNGDCWEIKIDITSGKILDWPIETIANVHFKVCDMCSYEIYDVYNHCILEESNNYVPSVLSPGGKGYGDYIIMNINSNGYIKDWNKELIKNLFE